jgi:hypothetical protein
MSQLVTISSEELSFVIDPSVAGRVVQVSFAGQSLLTGPEAHPENWGATFWTSPQADWSWPPVAEVDSLPYQVIEASSQRLGLRGPLAEVGEKKFRIEKWFSAQEGSCIDTSYVIESASAEPFRLAAWEISRVAGGVTFFPTGTIELTPIAPHGPLHLMRAADVSYFDHRSFQVGRSLKVHADGREGFLGHVTGQLLLLKFFEKTPHELVAPGEGEVEIFAGEEGRYVEVEVQGPFAEIAPGGRSRFAVRTHVARVAPEQGLAEWVRLARDLRQRYFDPGT